MRTLLKLFSVLSVLMGAVALRAGDGGALRWEASVRSIEGRGDSLSVVIEYQVRDNGLSRDEAVVLSPVVRNGNLAAVLRPLAVYGEGIYPASASMRVSGDLEEVAVAAMDNALRITVEDVIPRREWMDTVSVMLSSSLWTYSGALRKDSVRKLGTYTREGGVSVNEVFPDPFVNPSCFSAVGRRGADCAVRRAEVAYDLDFPIFDDGLGSNAEVVAPIRALSAACGEPSYGAEPPVLVVRLSDRVSDDDAAAFAGSLSDQVLGELANIADIRLERSGDDADGPDVGTASVVLTVPASLLRRSGGIALVDAAPEVLEPVEFYWYAEALRQEGRKADVLCEGAGFYPDVECLNLAAAVELLRSYAHARASVFLRNAGRSPEAFWAEGVRLAEAGRSKEALDIFRAMAAGGDPRWLDLLPKAEKFVKTGTGFIPWNEVVL